MYYIMHFFSDEVSNKSGTSVSQELFKMAVSEEHLFYKDPNIKKWVAKDNQRNFIVKKMQKVYPFENFSEGDIFYISKYVWAVITEIRKPKNQSEDFLNSDFYPSNEHIFNSNFNSTRSGSLDHINTDLATEFNNEEDEKTIEQLNKADYDKTRYAQQDSFNGLTDKFKKSQEVFDYDKIAFKD